MAPSCLGAVENLHVEIRYLSCRSHETLFVEGYPDWILFRVCRLAVHPIVVQYRKQLLPLTCRLHVSHAVEQHRRLPMLAVTCRLHVSPLVDQRRRLPMPKKPIVVQYHE